MRRAGASGAGESGERDGRLGEVECRGVEDAVVVDGGYIGASGGRGLGEEESRGEEEGRGLRAEGAAVGAWICGVMRRHRCWTFAEGYHAHGFVCVGASEQGRRAWR